MLHECLPPESPVVTIATTELLHSASTVPVRVACDSSVKVVISDTGDPQSSIKRTLAVNMTIKGVEYVWPVGLFRLYVHHVT
jgi:hypothetical protein